MLRKMLFESTIKNNSAGYGGRLADCDGTIEKCIITGNSATNNGGGRCSPAAGTVKPFF